MPYDCATTCTGHVLRKLLGAGCCCSDWSDFAPKLVKRACDGKMIVDTKFSQATGKPPVLMSGMTPTTSMLGVSLLLRTLEHVLESGSYHLHCGTACRRSTSSLPARTAATTASSRAAGFRCPTIPTRSSRSCGRHRTWELASRSTPCMPTRICGASSTQSSASYGTFTRVARRCLAQLLQFCYHNRDFSTYHGNRSRSSFCVVGHCSKKGTPIESLTIGAGVPTAEKAVEICDGTCAICPCHSFAARSQASTASA